LSIPGINGIGGCINLKELSLWNCSSLTGLFSGHHPHDDFDFNFSFAAVPNIAELKNLETLDLSSTGITGTVDLKHHTP
jgi:Leucine-rich repeat (LRR) protein